MRFRRTARLDGIVHCLGLALAANGANFATPPNAAGQQRDAAPDRAETLPAASGAAEKCRHRRLSVPPEPPLRQPCL